MQIVINIDDDLIQGIMNGKQDEPRNIVRSFQATIADAIKYGIPLPKGHGRLIDADKIGLTNFECFMCGGDYKEGLKMLIHKIETAPTIIKADKAESEDKE